ncbi:transposase [Sporolactobacillus shoreicorticis]|uniref:Transposase n=1 Tax=Sporolactobacillus shoreicorticis TaxID=1923877 RepID=A0ABW5S0R1_9BACL
MASGFAVGLLAEIGDVERFNSHHALAKYVRLVCSQYFGPENTARTIDILPAKVQRNYLTSI